MKKNTILTLILLVLPLMATAQDAEVPPVQVDSAWVFSSVLPEGGIPVDSALANASGMHGVAVDGDGKIWLQPFATTETIVLDGVGGDPVATRALYIYNPDGTEADFSPLTTFEYVDGSDVDTVGHYWNTYRETPGWEGMSGRGLKADDDGNIIVSTGGVIYRIRKDGKGMNKYPYVGADGLLDSPTAAAVDGQGNVYVAPVVPGANSLIKLPKDFSPSTTPEVLLAETPGFSRAFEVSDDGNTIYWNGYSNGAVYVYSRTDEFSPFDPESYTEMTGLASESATFNPVTGHIWLSGGSTFSPASNGYANQTWYAFDPSDLDTPLASITWNGDAMDNSAIGAGEGRPRGLAFSLDGGTAYVVQFNEAILAAQVFMGDASTSIEGEDEVNTTPQNFRLDQNYPNPFNPSTNIEFELPAAANTMLQVYDVSGRLVATLVNGNMPAGVHTVTFNASDLSSGVYFYMLRSGNLSMTKQMTLIK